MALRLGTCHMGLSICLFRLLCAGAVSIHGGNDGSY